MKYEYKRYGKIIRPVIPIKVKNGGRLEAQRIEGLFGSKPFSKTNEYLVEHNKQPIDWV